MVGLGSGEEFGIHCMIFGVCYSVSDSEDRDTTVVASESTSKADGRGDLCSGETDADLGGSRMTLTFCMPLLWAGARSLASGLKKTVTELVTGCLRTTKSCYICIK